MDGERGAGGDGVVRPLDAYGLAFTTSPVPQFVARTDGAIIVANPAYGALTGRSAESSVGTTPADVSHPDDLARLLEEGGRLLAGEIPVLELEVRIRREDGTYRSCIATATLADGPDGEPLFVCHLVDVTEQQQAAAELARSEERFRILADSLPVGVHQRDTAGRLVYVNERWTEITGLSAEESIGQDHIEIVHPDDRDRVYAASLRLASQGGSYLEEFRIIRPDGAVRWVSSRAAWLPGPDGKPAAYVGSLEDITAVRAAQVEVQRLASIAEATSDFVGIVDNRGWLIWANAAAREAYGIPVPEERIHASKLYTPESNTRFYQTILPQLMEGRTWSGELDMYTGDGPIMRSWQTLVPQLDAHGKMVTIAAVGRDITELRRVQADLAHRATHDVLTGLPNRALLLERLEREVDRRQPGGGDVAVLFIDLDRFKTVNDQMGHDAGDELLRRVAERLSEVLRPLDVVARLGGDEFVVVCPDLAGQAQAEEVATRILDALASKPVVVRGIEVPITASVGVTVFAGGKERHPERLLREADAAMYRAKARGRARFEVFEPDEPGHGSTLVSPPG